MSRQSKDDDSNNNNSQKAAKAIAIVGLNLALSYENAAVDRLEKRLSESIIPEVKEKIKRHLEQTKAATGRLKERITSLGGGGGRMEPISVKGNYPYLNPTKAKMIIEVIVQIKKEKFGNH